MLLYVVYMSFLCQLLIANYLIINTTVDNVDFFLKISRNKKIYIYTTTTTIGRKKTVIKFQKQLTYLKYK